MKNTYKLMLFVCAMFVATLAFTATASAKQYGRLTSSGYISAVANNGSLMPTTYRLGTSPLVVEVTTPSGFKVGEPTLIVMKIRYKNAKFRPKIGWKKRYKTTFYRAFGKRRWPILPTFSASWGFWASGRVMSQTGKKIYVGPRQTRVVKFWVTFPECAPIDEEWILGPMTELKLKTRPAWQCNPPSLGVSFENSSLKSRRIKINGKIWQWTAYASASAPVLGAFLYPSTDQVSPSPPSPPTPAEPTPTGPTGPPEPTGPTGPTG